jgi:hypothetical protein
MRAAGSSATLTAAETTITTHEIASRQADFMTSLPAIVYYEIDQQKL